MVEFEAEMSLHAILNPTKPGRVTVADKLGHGLAAGTLNSIVRQLSIEAEWR
jgi:predicted RNA binding protein YcfA (HicA-like mRNA interferase family)